MKKSDLLALLSLGALWGASFLFMRMGADEFGGMALAGMRAIGSVICSIPLLTRARLSEMRAHWRDIAIVYAWLVFSVAALAALSFRQTGGSFSAALWNAGVYGVLIPFLVWNVFISFVTIVQHTGPKVRWVTPTGRFSTHEERLGGTVHLVFPEALDWFFHRVMQHVVLHVNPIIPLYRLKREEAKLFTAEPAPIMETWTPLYHWRMTQQCKLYDPATKSWRRFPTLRGRLKGGAAAPA